MLYGEWLSSAGATPPKTIEGAGKSAGTLAQGPGAPAGGFLIITCEECETRFELDASRIPERGVRVRCSRCQHKFMVKPAASAGDPVEHAVERALDEEVSGPASSDDPVQESDWEFNDEGLSQEADEGLPQEPDEGLPQEADEGLSQEADDGRSPQAGHATPNRATAQDVVDHLLGPSATSPPAAPVASVPASSDELDDLFETDPGPELGGYDASIDAEPQAPAPAPAESEPPAPPARAREEELGSPENWDFFSEEAAAPPPAQTSPMRIPLGRIGVPSDGSGVATGTGPVAVPIEPDADASRGASWLAAAAHGVGWAVASALVALLLSRGLVPSVAPEAERVQPLAGLEARDLRGRWVENVVQGDVFVISGQLANPGNTAKAPAARLAVRLYDRHGAVLAREAAAVGPALSPGRLREERPRELRALLAAESVANAWVPLGPRSSRAFHAVLADLPREAARFDLVSIALDEPMPVPEPLPEAPLLQAVP